MEQADNYISYGSLVVVLIFFIIWTLKYFSYGRQLKKAFLQAGMTWPIPPRNELLQEMRRNYFSGYRRMVMGVIGLARIVFFMRTDDPSIAKPLCGIRRSLLIFVLFPFVLVFVAVVVGLFLSGT